MNKLCKTSELYGEIPEGLKDLFSCEYPWEMLPEIKQKALDIIANAPKGYTLLKEGVLIGENVKIAPTAAIEGPTVIGSNTEIRPGAFIRGSVIIGEGCVIGNSTELKNCVLFNGVQAPHYNYVGDSIYGHKAHTGAGVIASNLKADKSLVTVNFRGERVETGIKKIGAIVGDFGDIGCNTVMNPGTVIGRNTSVYPLSFVRSYVEEGSIYKKQGEVVKRY